jgi:imidazolonepropionase-like amidohydrolase
MRPLPLPIRRPAVPIARQARWLWPTLALLAGLAAPAAAAPPARTWIVGATVISPERGDDGRVQQVLIEGDRIAAIADTLPPDAARDATLVDGHGAFLIPGLIDGHVHLRSVPGMTPVMEYLHPGLVRDYRAQLPRAWLRHGFTTVVDLVPTDRDVLDDFLAAPAHPDLLHCGAVPLAGGYPTNFAPRLLRDRVFRDQVAEPAPTPPPGRTPAAAVARARQDGARCIKTFFERGFGRDHDLPVPSAALFAQIRDAAHAAGLPVLLHASSLEAQRFGVEGGADILAHGLWEWGADNAATSLPEAVRMLLDDIARRQLPVMPTLQVIGGLRVLFDDNHGIDAAAAAQVLPPSLLAWLQTPAGQWLRSDLADGRSDAQMRARLDALLWRGGEAARYLASHGGRFAFGSDTPSGPTPGNLPGLNARLELQRLAAAQLSPRQILQAATLHNAQAFGLADEVGTIAVGRRANLLLLGQSPLQSVAAYDTLRTVWIGGRMLAPDSLLPGR